MSKDWQTWMFRKSWIPPICCGHYWQRYILFMRFFTWLHDHKLNIVSPSISFQLSFIIIFWLNSEDDRLERHREFCERYPFEERLMCFGKGYVSIKVPHQKLNMLTCNFKKWINSTTEILLHLSNSCMYWTTQRACVICRYIFHVFVWNLKKNLFSLLLGWWVILKCAIVSSRCSIILLQHLIRNSQQCVSEMLGMSWFQWALWINSFW